MKNQSSYFSSFIYINILVTLMKIVSVSMWSISKLSFTCYCHLLVSWVLTFRIHHTMVTAWFVNSTQTIKENNLKEFRLTLILPVDHSFHIMYWEKKITFLTSWHLKCWHLHDVEVINCNHNVLIVYFQMTKEFLKDKTHERICVAYLFHGITWGILIWYLC